MSNKVLLLTSCNRIKQTLLALTINSYIIKEPFHLIISDGSSFGETWEQNKSIHSYWHDEVFEKNYCSDITLFEKYIKLIPNILSYKIIHAYPKLPKQIGEASLLNLGIAQAANTIPNSICVKINGVVMLKYNIFKDIETIFNNENKDIYLYSRTNMNDQISTRVFGFRPEILSPVITKKSWDGWYEYPSIQKENIGVRTKWIELQVKQMLDNELLGKVYHSGFDESIPLLDEGKKHNYNNLEEYKQLIANHIHDNNIPLDHPLIEDFLDNKIW